MTDQLSSVEAAAVAGVKPSTWRDYVAKAAARLESGDQRPGDAPQPDGKIGNSNWWYRVTVEQWMRDRPGRGARTDLTS